MGALSATTTAAAAAVVAVQFPEQSLLQSQRGAFSITTRTQTCFPGRLLFVRVKSVASKVDELHDFRVVSSTVLTAEKEEAKAVLTLFLKKQGLSNEAAEMTISKSDRFINHLVSRLHSIFKTWYLVGRELTTLEIRDALIPCLESFLEEHGDILVDAVENFPNQLEKELVQPISHASPTDLPTLDPKKLKAMARVSELGTDGQLPPHIMYLMDIGMEMDQIKAMARRFPSFAYYSLERKIKPLVEFLLDLGVPPSNIPLILRKCPQLCSISLSENIIPTMAYFEELGLDKSLWARVINQFPPLLTCSTKKVKATVNYLRELGISEKIIGKVLTRCPQIMSYSVDDNLRPKAEYFRSMGTNLPSLFGRFPQIFGLSIENNLKLVTEFFLDKGYSIEDIGTMASRYGAFYYFSLTKNLIPKWDFFLTTGFSREELVKFPHYFGYSLEGRIKPRYAQVKESGVKMGLNNMLAISDSAFEKVLNKKIMKLQEAKEEDSTTVTFTDDFVSDKENTLTIISTS